MVLQHDRLLLDRLRQRITDVVGTHLHSGSRVAFINYPSISNVGDPALWLGTWRVLDDLDVQVVYACDAPTYDPAGVERSDADWIVINGGGNFGDLWRGQQQVREQVFRDFPDVSTLQLPQSIWFEEHENLERVRTLMEGHAGLHLLWRDDRSLSFARENLPGRHVGCPDTALALEPRSRDKRPRVDVLWLKRTDKESQHDSNVGFEGRYSVEVTDWVDPGVGPGPSVLEGFALRAQERLGSRLSDGGHRRLFEAIRRATFAPVARYHLRRGLAVLGRGRVVVTDRLHAHILCLVSGIPHVVLDNSYGKLRAVYSTWTHEARSVRWADTTGDAARLVEDLLGEL